MLPPSPRITFRSGEEIKAIESVLTIVDGKVVLRRWEISGPWPGYAASIANGHP